VSGSLLPRFFISNSENEGNKPSKLWQSVLYKQQNSIIELKVPILCTFIHSRRGLIVFAKSRIPGILFLLFLILAACSSATTPVPGEPVTMENVCKFDRQVVEVEGQLSLPQAVSCTIEEPITCDLYLDDPLNGNSIVIKIPVSNGDGEIPVNHMAALPEEYESVDFYIHTEDNDWVKDHSFVSVRGTVSSDYSGADCSISQVEAITRKERMSYPGIDITHTTLQQALTEGIVIATINGGGLTQIYVKLKPKIESNLEVEIAPGTIFISAAEGVQNMVLKEEQIVYLKPTLEVGFEFEVSCGNMELKQPEYENTFDVSDEPASDDLLKLLANQDFAFYDSELQQFAVWTITDNPTSPGAYVGIQSGDYVL
jgi:hypothetical protein